MRAGGGGGGYGARGVWGGVDWWLVTLIDWVVRGRIRGWGNKGAHINTLTVGVRVSQGGWAGEGVHGVRAGGGIFL